MKVLVLGGTLFVGRAVVEVLLSRGHDVSVLNRGSRPLSDDRIRQLTADRNSPGEVAVALTGEYEAVVDVSGTEPRHAENVVASLRLSPGAPYVYISSASVYERAAARAPFREHDPAGGDTIWGGYGEAKAACERILRGALGGAMSILRPPYIYGPRNTEQREQFLWARIIARQPIFVPGDGSTAVQFCHAEALAAVVAAACEGSLPRETYNIGEPRFYSFSEYVALLGEIAGVKPWTENVADEPVPARQYFPFRQADLTLSTDKIAQARVLPQISLAEGLASTFAWFRAEGLIKDEPTPQERAWRTSLACRG